MIAGTYCNAEFKTNSAQHSVRNWVQFSRDIFCFTINLIHFNNRLWDILQDFS